MNTNNILKTINSWAKEERVNYVAQVLTGPPPFADVTLDASHGVCLTLLEPEPSGEEPNSLVCWIPTSGKGGFWVLLKGGHQQFQTGASWFSTSFREPSVETPRGEITFAELETFISTEPPKTKRVKGGAALKLTLNSPLFNFLQWCVLGPALKKWMASKGLATRRFKPMAIDCYAYEAGLDDWYLLQFREPWQGYPHSRVVGVSGWRQVGFLKAKPMDTPKQQYSWDFLGTPETVSTPSQLFAWLDKNLVLSPRAKGRKSKGEKA